jgi:hypothetical protein
MSTFVNTGSDLDSTTLPGAFAEALFKLNTAERVRNAANPNQPPKNFVTSSADFDGGVLNIATTIPLSPIRNSTGQVVMAAKDYLGSTYSAFVPGTSDVESTNLVAVVLELASLLSDAEKAVLPVADQPNNVIMSFDYENSQANITATLPITAALTASGSIDVIVTDYL